MQKSTWWPLAPVMTLALLLSSCGEDDTPTEEPQADPDSGSSVQAAATVEEDDDAEAPEPVAEDSAEESDDPAERPVELSGEMTGEIFTDSGDNIHGSMPVELWPECTDPEALAANEGHEPAGWPQDWDGEGVMPEPECHPNYIEMLEWDQFESFSACWEGMQTSAFYSAEQFETVADLRAALWEQSRERAEWPGYEGTCEEQMAQHEEAGGYDD